MVFSKLLRMDQKKIHPLIRLGTPFGHHLPILEGILSKKGRQETHINVTVLMKITTSIGSKEDHALQRNSVFF